MRNWIYTGSLSLVFLWACGGSPEPNTGTTADNSGANYQGLPGNYLDGIEVGAQTRCYHLNLAEAREELILDFGPKGFKGRGILRLKGDQAMFRIDLEGRLLNEDQAEVQLSYFLDQGQGPAELVPRKEQWRRDPVHGGWLVAEREVESHKGEALYVPVRCAPGDNQAKFDAFYGFFEGYAVVQNGKHYGLLAEDGQLVLPTVYRDLSAVSEGSVAFSDTLSERYGVMEVPSGKVLIPAKYDNTNPYNEGLAAFVGEKGLWGFMDRQGKVVIKPRFSSINIYDGMPMRKPFNEGLANVFDPEAAWGFIDRTGKVVIPLRFLFADAFKDGKARVFAPEVTNGASAIDKQGRCVNNCTQFDESKK